MIVPSQPLRFGRYDLKMALFVSKREVRDSFRDWRIIIPIVLLTLVFPALATFVARLMMRFTARYGAQLIGDQLVPFLLLVVGFFPMSFSLVIALETFVGEKERNSLEPLLATPLTDAQLYVGKMLAAIIPPMSTSYLGIAVYLVGLVIVVGWVVPVELTIQILLLSTVQGIIMVAAAVIVSSQTTSVRAANLLASFIIVPVALLLQFEAIVMFWGNSEGLWWLILVLAITALVLIRMGIKIFNRDELLGKDIDQLNIVWIWRQFWNRFTGKSESGRYPGPLHWYRQTIAIVPQLKLSFYSSLAAFVLAIVLGTILTRMYPASPLFQSGMSATDITANISGFQDFLSRLPAAIFFQNLRVVGLAAILGIFTFGVLDLLIFMLPWTFITYLAMQLTAAGADGGTFVIAAVLPHAILEFSALLIAAAAGLRWHATILAPPPNSTISRTWLMAAADYSRLLVGLVIPLLIVAAFVEAMVTPQVVLHIYGG